MLEENYLKPMFSYSLLPLFVLLGGIILLLLSLILKKKTKKQVVRTTLPKVVETKIWINDLEELKQQVIENKISNRQAYQKLSKLLRSFTEEKTKKKLSNYSLTEIKKLKIPKISELIEEYYVPEFAKQEEKNILKSIEKTKKVIEEWK